MIDYEEIINEKYKYSELTGKMIGCSMEVHKILGNAFQEVIYQMALEEEFFYSKSYRREFEMTVYYKEKIVGTRRVGFFINEVVSLEIKVLTKLKYVHLAQAINYLEAYNIEIGNVN